MALALGGCDTIDVGPPTGPPMGCNASPSYFVQKIWPEYLVPNDCSKSDCHDALSGHGYFRLQSVDGVAAPDPTQPPASWPEPWRNNFISASRLVNCADPESSLLLAVPEGRGQPHPAGDVVKDHAAAEALFREWAKQL